MVWAPLLRGPLTRRVRCAIYTRKSTEEGLDQDFNTLDAQREACEAYVASQKHEGWEVLPDHYDDGGISGGHLERPALQRLMQAVDDKRVDQIVVYKIDRLTRSLSDFAKLVDRLDAAEASFVSVTQSFNTATSMGRLTLNVLLKRGARFPTKRMGQLLELLPELQRIMLDPATTQAQQNRLAEQMVVERFG